MAVSWGYCENNDVVKKSMRPPRRKKYVILILILDADWNDILSSLGPSTWESYFPEAKGERQSPIDIRTVNLKTLDNNKKLQWKYVAENCIDVTNPGYCWKVHVHGEGSELQGGPLEGKYVIEQFHCHWGDNNDEGSEHTVEGKSYAGELHFVHWNSTKYASFAEAAEQPDGLCVLGVLIKAGKHNEEFDKIVKHLENIQYKGDTVPLATAVDPNALIPENSGYWTYLGSLTTPPCSECVIWIVFQDPIEVSDEQLQACRKLRSVCESECECVKDEFDGYVKKNFRPTYPLGQREVRECRQ